MKKDLISEAYEFNEQLIQAMILIKNVPDIHILCEAAQVIASKPTKLLRFLSLKNGYRYYNEKVFINDFLLPYYIKEDLIKIIRGELLLPKHI